MVTDETIEIGRCIADLRNRRGWSQEKLANKAGVHINVVGRVERGEGSDESREAVAKVFGMRVRVRRELMPVKSSSGEVLTTQDDVTVLREDVQRIIALDNHHGGDDLVSMAVRIFRNAHQRLASERLPRPLQRDLTAAAAEAGEVAAWVAYDSDKQGLCRSMNQEALLLAQLAGDRSMELFVFSNLSMQDIHLGRPMEGLRIAEHVLGDGARGRVAVLFHIRRARALAQLGDRRNAVEALARACSILNDGIGAKDPVWTWWIDKNELASHQARTHSDLSDWKTAYELQCENLSSTDGSRNRYMREVHAFRCAVALRAWQDAEGFMTSVMKQLTAYRSAHTAATVLETLALIKDAPSSISDAAEGLRLALVSPTGL